MRTLSTLIGVLLVAGIVFACTDTLVEPANESAALEAGDLPASPVFSGNGVTELVSAGGADICEALGQPTGCDANFSLSAVAHADGSIGGQWQDTFGDFSGGGALHVAIDCLHVVGNGAVLGGVITHATGAAAGNEGQRALAAVVDNGTSVNDPADQISFSNFPTGGLDCTTLVPGNFALFNLTNGQVKVK